MKGKNKKPYLHFPKLLEGDSRERLLEGICKDARKCLPIKSCFIKNGIPKPTYYRWLEWLREEIEAENWDAPLVTFFDEVYKAERESEAVIWGVDYDNARNGNQRAVEHILNVRFDYGKNKQEVELSTKEDSGFEINIVPMTSVETDKEEE